MTRKPIETRWDRWNDAAFTVVACGLDAWARKLDPYIPGGMDYTKINVIGFFGLLLLLAASMTLNVVLLLR